MLLYADLSEEQELLLNNVCGKLVAEDAPNTNYVIPEKFLAEAKSLLDSWNIPYRLM